MTDIAAAGTWRLGSASVRRMGYGAMQLAGPHVFGPPKDPENAKAVLRAAVAAGVNHIDTSDYYGPFVTNELIREALFPYPEELTIVTKVGAARGPDASWNPAITPDELVSAVHDNLARLGLEVLDVVNYRVMGRVHAPGDEDIRPQIETLARLVDKGLIRNLGVSNASRAQIEAAHAITPIVCVQNLYNLANRADDAVIDWLAGLGVAYVPFFPLGGFSPLQSDALTQAAAELGATPMQLALAWLLRRAPNILLIPGTASLDHLRENLAAADLQIPAAALAALDAIGRTDAQT